MLAASADTRLNSYSDPWNWLVPDLVADVDHAAAGASVFRREVRGHNPELLHRVQRNALADRCGEQIDVFAAIQQDVGVRRALAVDGITGAAMRSVCPQPRCPRWQPSHRGCGSGSADQ